jgi:hypothetical protein
VYLLARQQRGAHLLPPPLQIRTTNFCGMLPNCSLHTSSPASSDGAR